MPDFIFCNSRECNNVGGLAGGVTHQSAAVGYAAARLTHPTRCCIDSGTLPLHTRLNKTAVSAAGQHGEDDMTSVTAADLGTPIASAAPGRNTIEGFVGHALDDAKISPLHRRVIALIAAGYFCDVIDFTVFGSLVPFIIKSGFGAAADAAMIGSATIFGLAIGTAGQGELSDRFGRRFIYQFNLLLFGIFTILGAFAPSITVLVVCRIIAGIGLGAEQPLAFAYAGEYAPKRIRGRILAIVHFIGGACVWPIGTGFVLGMSVMIATYYTDAAQSAEHVWRGVWLVIGVLALIVWVFRFTPPESTRYLATQAR